MQHPNGSDGKILPYQRDERGVRPWILPGTKGLEHRIGGLEKEDITGNVSYEPLNHEKMVHLRISKIKNIENYIPPVQFDCGNETSELLVLSWGSTYGSVKTAVHELVIQNYDIAHIHLSYLNPFPSNLGSLLMKFDKIIIPEINSGQLLMLIRNAFLIPATGFSKIQGLPFTIEELKRKIIDLLKEK